MKTIVVGAGITGLTIAYELTKAGWPVEVWERNSQPGGLLSTLALGRGRLEKYYHHFFAQDEDACQLLAELNIADHLFWKSPRMGMFSQGNFYNFSTPWDLLCFAPLSFRERIKLGLFSLQAKKQEQDGQLDKQTAEEWLIKQVGPQVTAAIWQPMLRAKFGQHYREVPAAWLLSRLAARAQSRGLLGWREKLGYLEGSSQVLLDALQDKLNGKIRLNTVVKQVPVTGYDLTIVTTPEVYCPPQLSYLGNICVLLKMRRPLTPYYWVNVADQQLPFCAVVEQTNAFDCAAYQGAKIAYLSSYLDQQDQRWQQTDQQIIADSMAGLRQMLPDFAPNQVTEALVFRSRYAQPLPTVQSAGQIPPFKVTDRFYFVSNMQIYPEDRGVSQSIKLAKRFCRELRLV